MSFLIRFATRDDMYSVHDLITELAIFEKEPEAVEVTVEDLQRDGFSNQPKFKVLVAVQSGEIIGMALFYERYSTWKGKALHLEDLIVTQSKRKLGVGKALYAELMKYAHKNKFNRVAWEVLDWNTNAIEFYEKSGAKVLEDWGVVQMDKQGLQAFIENN